MTLEDQSAVLLAFTPLIYVLAMVGLLLLGWLFRVGLVTFVISCIPPLWQVLFTDSDAPGFGVLFLLMIPLPLLLMALGVMRAIFRGLRRWLRPATDRRGAA